MIFNIQQGIALEGEPNDDEEKQDEDDSVKQLKQWKLEEYFDLLVNKSGYSEVEDWQDLDFDELTAMGFKPGTARKLIRKVKENLK